MQPIATPGEAAAAGEATGLAAGDAAGDGEASGLAPGEGASAAADAGDGEAAAVTGEAGGVVAAGLLVGAVVGVAACSAPQAVSRSSGATPVTQRRIAARREIRDSWTRWASCMLDRSGPGVCRGRGGRQRIAR